MAWKMLNCSIPLAGIIALGILFAGPPSALNSQELDNENQIVEPALVNVTIITKIRDVMDIVEINGKPIRNYRPTIAQIFSSTGIVLDRPGYILIFRGDRWVDIQNRESSDVTVFSETQKLKGKLIGIDQRNGVAVVHLLEGKIKPTPICSGCEFKDGAFVEAPIFTGPGQPQLHHAQVVSVGANQPALDPGRWMITVNRPFPDIGQPILDSNYRVLGFVASQDETGVWISPIAELLSSADKIILKGGDIQAGWLGVSATDLPSPAGFRVRIEEVDTDSPAQKAGLSAMDLITGYNGRQINDYLQLIQLIESTPIGSKIKLDIMRGGNPMTVAAVIGARKPQQIQRKLAFNLPSPSAPPVQRPFVGLDTEMLNPSLAAERQISQKEGLLVMGVEDQTPAKLAGILVDDIIIAIDDKPIKDSLSFSSYLQTINWGARLVFKIFRKGTEINIPVQLPSQPQ
jgi:serine protease Do